MKIVYIEKLRKWREQQKLNLSIILNLIAFELF